jgi:hypothetical protein
LKIKGKTLFKIKVVYLRDFLYLCKNFLENGLEKILFMEYNKTLVGGINYGGKRI